MSFFTHFGRYLLMIKGMMTRPENYRMYWKEFMHQCVEIGIGSLGIVMIISVFMGAVSAVQTAYQLVSPLIPKSTIAQIVRDTVILEFAPTVVCIVLAGVVGSKIASELGQYAGKRTNRCIGDHGYQYQGLPRNAENSSHACYHTYAGSVIHGIGYLGWPPGRITHQYFINRYL